MRRRTVETLAWLLIYSGLLLVALGWAIQDAGAAWGRVLWIVGVVDAAAGVVCIWWRSRMQETDP